MDLQKTLGVLADIASIIALFLSSYAVYKVAEIQQTLTQSGKNNKALSQNAKGDNNTQIGLQQ